MEAQGLRGTFRDDVLKMLKDSMVALKGVRWNYLYYLKGSTMIGHVAASEGTNKNYQTMAYEVGIHM